MSITAIIITAIVFIYLVCTLIEIINLNKFNIKFFDYGVTIFHKEINIHFSNWRYLDGIYEEKEGQYAFIPEMKMGYFKTIFNLYRSYGIFGGSLFPTTIFGSFIEENGKLKIKYKVSYRIIFLISLFFIPWIIIPILQGSLLAILVGLGGILISSFLIYLFYFFKQGLMLIISDEIGNILNIK